MLRKATQNIKAAKTNEASFQPVFDSRKRKIPGLWLRGEWRHYVQMRVERSTVAATRRMNKSDARLPW